MYLSHYCFVGNSFIRGLLNSVRQGVRVLSNINASGTHEEEEP